MECFNIYDIIHDNLSKMILDYKLYIVFILMFLCFKSFLDQKNNRREEIYRH